MTKVSSSEIEVRQAVELLNEEITELFPGKWEDYPPQLTFTSNGLMYWVELAGEGIWDSENDGRLFFEDKNDWEPIADFLRREIRQIAQSYQRLLVLGSLDRERVEDNKLLLAVYSRAARRKPGEGIELSYDETRAIIVALNAA